VETFNSNIQINRYDAEGLRHEMEENGKLVTFIYRGDEVIAEESQEDKIRYIRTSVLLASDAENARTYYHYASDEMGSITHVTDSENEEILNHYEYDAWGNLTACEEKVHNRFKFNGQQYDPISQQYYLRARYYNPVIGRFTQEDSYNVDGLNLYVYCRNNPVSYVDPSGNICGRRANTLMDNVLSGKPLTRKERRQLSAKLRDEARNGTISNKGRYVALQMGIDVGAFALLRGDDLLYSDVGKNGIRKSYISSEGDLMPTNVTGNYKGRQVTVTEHILGGYRSGAKRNSPYTSFTPNQSIGSGYGNNLISVDISRLRKAIQSGEVTGVAILSPKQIQKLIRNDNTQSDYWKSRALKWTKRDSEYLIRGIIPSEFITINH